MDFELRKEDILKIGFSTKSEHPDVGTRFICNPITAQIEKIFLRNIFKLFEEDGEYYMITDVFDKTGHTNPGFNTIEYITNFPYEKYEQILFS